MKFDYLKDIPELKSLYELVNSDSNSKDSPWNRCLCYGRRLEELVRYTYSIQFPKYKVASSMLSKLVSDKNFKSFLGSTDNYNKLRYIILAGNNASLNHEIDDEEAELSFENLKEITYYIFSKINKFDEDQREVFKYEAPKKLGISEAKTRELFIDVNLKNAGYKVNNYKDNHGHGRPVADNVCVEIEVHNLPNQNTGYIDYVIYDKSGLPVAVIEAKRTSVSEEAGAQQARDYADALKKELDLKYRPVVYYTNGYVIKIQDRLGYPAREVSNFASLKDLQLMISRQQPGNIDARKPILNKEVDEKIIDRTKLIEAIKEMIDSMNVGGKLRRKGLLVLPCGVGKTRVAVALSKILIENNWVKNVLFLADRNNLVSNALKPFKKYMDCEVSDISAENPDRNLDARICVCTYNSMLNILNKPKKDFSVGHFDLIFVDEAHRSLFNVYRAIFDYFDSFLIGLTATPSKALDRSTYEILDLNVDQPTFEVKFEEAVNLGYLVSYKAFDKTSQVLKNGVKYKDLSDKEKEEYEDLFSEEDELSPEVFERTINTSGYLVNDITIDVMLNDLFTNGLKVEQGNKIGKTLIFARDHKHAELIVERFKKNYSKLGDDFCQIIDNQIKKNKTRQDNYAKKDSNPQIVVSVDMMDTGVDIPEIVNLVFFKKVLSKIKFDQMWGRGTRTCKNLHVVSPSKDYFEGRTKDNTPLERTDKQGFYVFDYCDNFEFFDLHPEGNNPSYALNLNQKIYSIRLEMLVALQELKYQENEQYKQYYDQLKTYLVKKISDLDTNRIDVHSKLLYVDRYKNLDEFQHLNERKIYEIKSNLLRLIEPDTIDDTTSKSLDYRIDVIQLSLVKDDIVSIKQQKQLMETAKALLQKASIADILAKKETLKSLKEDAYYEKLDFFELEKVKREVGPLMKYLKDNNESSFSYTSSFNDEIETKGRDIKYNFDDFKTYREKFISYLNTHFGELESVKKIINLETLNQKDLDELQNILNALRRPEDEPLFTNTEDLIIFVRKIVGLDRESIDKKCSKFINKNDFNKEQRQLINLIIDFATRNGNITNYDIANSEPFENMDIPEMFNNNIDPILGILNIFNQSLQINA